MGCLLWVQLTMLYPQHCICMMFTSEASQAYMQANCQCGLVFQVIWGVHSLTVHLEWWFLSQFSPLGYFPQFFKIIKTLINTLRPRRNGCPFADNTFKRIFLNENVRIAIWISLKFVRKGPINNIPALIQKMAWRQLGDKPLSEPMMVSLLTHIWVTRPQWVNHRSCRHTCKVSLWLEWFNNNCAKSEILTTGELMNGSVITQVLLIISLAVIWLIRRIFFIIPETFFLHNHDHT